MTLRRDKPDGLPFRVYERRGVRVYSIGYKTETGAWAWRLQCPANDAVQIRALRAEAMKRAAAVGAQPSIEGTFEALGVAWLKWQESLPAGASGKRAESTLNENRRELKRLNTVFGPVVVSTMEKGDAYGYLDACLLARDKAGNPRPRPEKGNKEISLARVILEWGVRRGWLKVNPFDGVEKLVTDKEDRLVTPQEMALAVEVGRRMGGPQHICALGLKTAFLCVRRSVEVRALTRDQIAEPGIEWKAAKRQRGQAERVALIEWSDELRATIDEALAIKRHKLAGSRYVFGNLDGQRYTKGGWKATLAKLMAACVAEAESKKVAFRPFSLQDCRPMGTSAKMERGDDDVIDATLHTSERMVRQVYDRRRKRVAKPAA